MRSTVFRRDVRSAAFQRLLVPFAFAYLVFVSLVLGGLIALGYLLSRLPWRPPGGGRSYRSFLVWTLDAAVRPFDALSPPDRR